MKAETLKPLVTTPKRQGREKRAAFLKYQIYGTVTLMAVNAGFLLQPKLTPDHALVIIASTGIGLWLASMFASVMSYRLTHDSNLPREELIHELTVHRGLLLAAVPSLIMFSLAAFDVIELRTAILTDISMAGAALSLAILRSAKTATNTYADAAISVSLQAILALAIIAVMASSK